jgi:hypothetical protein
MLKWEGKAVRVVFHAYGNLSNEELQDCLLAVMEQGVKPFLDFTATVGDVVNTM